MKAAIIHKVNVDILNYFFAKLNVDKYLFVCFGAKIMQIIDLSGTLK